MTRTRVVKSNGALPANVKDLVAGLAASQQSAASGNSGKLFLKMEKSGDWVYGVNGEPVGEDSLFAVNPTSFVHGWICWGNENSPLQGQRQGEAMGPAASPLSPMPPAVENATWSHQVGFSLQGYSGDDVDIELSWSGNSKGALTAYADLLAELVDAISSGDGDVVPIVALTATHYKHARYGKIYTPLFDVTDWMPMEGPVGGGGADPEPVQEEEAPKPKPKPKRKARKAPRKAKAETKPEPEPEPEPEYDEDDDDEYVAAPVIRRRRR